MPPQTPYTGPARAYNPQGFDDYWMGGCKTLSSVDRKRFKTPEGGIWTYTKAALLTINERENRRAADNAMSDTEPIQEGYLISWDKEQGKGHKLFARYESAQAFCEAILALPREDRHAYEIICPDRPVRAYMDIEYVTDEPDVEQTRIRMVLDHYRKKVVQEFGFDPEIHVSSSSRGEAGRFKMSYHVTFQDLVFQNNCNGEMLEFFSVTQDNFSVDSDWFFTKDQASGKRVPIVDQKVYDRYRNMRTLFSCKKGSDTPFRRVSQDPRLDTLDPAPCVCDTASDYHLFTNTMPANTPVSKPLSSDTDTENTKRGSSRSTRRPVPQRQCHQSVQPPALPFDLCCLVSR
jgi:hypothetical protein